LGRRGDHRSLIASDVDEAKPRSVVSKQIELLDTLVSSHAVAYVTDRHGTVANPAVPCRLRELMHQLAELTFERDGRYPRWWRAVGEKP
jgi:hypothetical protein